MISIPLVLTLGEYSAVIAVRLAKIYPIFAGLNSANKVKNICNILNRLTDLGSEIVLFGGVKVLAPIKDAYRYYGNIRNIDEATDALKQIENGVDPILDDASDFNKIEDFIDDANQFDNRVTFLDETESSIVSSGLSKVPFDGNLYIAIHGDKDFFEVISNGVSFKIDHRSLSTWIKKNNPSATNIVLLSCSDFNSAQNLANKLGDKKVIAWEGDVTVFESGAIQGEGRCREFSKSFDRNSFNFKELSGETVPAGLANAEKAGPSVSLGRRGRLTRGSDEIIVDNNGVTRFADELVEADYQYYLAFKRRQNRPPRDRADWKRASDYMKFDSPLARGNRFDDILRVEYPFTQVQIGRKFYLDAFVPPSNGKRGQIISGKAIDLDAIDDRTFRKHCEELITKYKKNSLITTKKDGYSSIENTLLDGDYFLCLPANNKNSPLLSDFEKIAKEYEIEIIFIAEGK